jgi:hypothetical protein
MKKQIIILFFFLLLAQVSFSQDVMKNKKISTDEVPTVVASAFKKDFPEAEGKWSVFYTQQLNGSNAVLTPKWYLFALNGDMKSVAQYSPSGKLERSKGMESKSASASAPASKGSN